MKCYIFSILYSNDAKVLFKDLNENRVDCLWNEVMGVARRV